MRNHAAGIASLDVFVVRTISFELLYGMVILRQARRQLVSIAVTAKSADPVDRRPGNRRLPVLTRAIAYLLQELAFGGLKPATRRLLEQTADAQLV